jgi:fluoroacetyl-CoA thioesterase
MRDDLVPGITLTLFLNTGDLPRPDGQPPIPAATLLVGCMERACIEALRPYLQDNEDTAGTQICLGELTPTPASGRIAAQAELMEVKGSVLRFRVDCYDDGGLIGSGFHERMVISRTPFADLLRGKTAPLLVT